MRCSDGIKKIISTIIIEIQVGKKMAKEIKRALDIRLVLSIIVFSSIFDFLTFISFGI